VALAWPLVLEEPVRSALDGEGDVVPRETRSVFGNEVPVSTSITVPGHVKNWVGPFLALQEKDTYEEIAQKKPHGDLPH